MPGSAAPLRYLALGDSYTIGEGVPADGRWPEQLASALRAGGLPVADPQVIATTGWTTDELNAGMDAAAPVGPFDLVTLLIGVNNQYRGLPLEDYRSEFAQLLRRALALAGGNRQRVLVVSIPDWGVTAFAQGRDTAQIATQIDAFNQVAAHICRDNGVAFIDITPTSRDGGDQPAMLAADGLHPSAAMYARWTTQIAPVALARLSEAPR